MTWTWLLLTWRWLTSTDLNFTLNSLERRALEFRSMSGGYFHFRDNGRADRLDNKPFHCDSHNAQPFHLGISRIYYPWHAFGTYNYFDYSKKTAFIITNPLMVNWSWLALTSLEWSWMILRILNDLKKSICPYLGTQGAGPNNRGSVIYI